MSDAEIIKAAVQCADVLGCTGCPLEECESCANYFANYIKIKSEPAPVEEVTDSMDIFDSNKYITKKMKSQAIEKSRLFLIHIIELSDDIIGDDDSTPEIAGFAGNIKGIANVLKEMLEVCSHGGV